jgi:hypothetical protein
VCGHMVELHLLELPFLCVRVGQGEVPLGECWGLGDGEVWGGGGALPRPSPGSMTMLVTL